MVSLTRRQNGKIVMGVRKKESGAKMEESGAKMEEKTESINAATTLIPRQ